jgi:hypothetical protein
MRIMHQPGVARSERDEACGWPTAARVTVSIPFSHASHAANSLVNAAAGADTSAASTRSAATVSGWPMHE